jgi:hypothetical protein
MAALGSFCRRFRAGITSLKRKNGPFPFYGFLSNTFIILKRFLKLLEPNPISIEVYYG